MSTQMDVNVRTEMVIDGQTVTHRQLETLVEVGRRGSMTSAARALGISVPVVHRYIRSVEQAVGAPVTCSTPSGTSLTREGTDVVRMFQESEARVEVNRGFSVRCSPVLEDLMTSVLSSLRLSNVELAISDDVHNSRALEEGRADLAIIDDPLYLYDLDDLGFDADEVGYMGMVYVDNGPSFIRYKYGAQRVAFMFLDSMGREYSIDSETYSLSEMLGSTKSFFVDEFLLVRKGIRMKSAVDPKVLRHAITAVYRERSKTVDRIVRTLQSRDIR